MIQSPAVVVCIGALTLALVVLRKATKTSHDPREPPLAPQSIPLIGHIIGLARRNFEYYVDLSHQTDAPIFTVSLPGQKMYVIAKPDLIRAAQKQHRILAFPPISAKFSTKICGSSPHAQTVIDASVFSDEGDSGIWVDIHDAMHAALRPGAPLDDMNRDMLKRITEALDELEHSSANAPQTWHLNAWLKDAVTTATTRSVYGPRSPFEDKAVVDAFWEFEKGLMLILVGILPSITARKATAARDKVGRAFLRYFQSDALETASAYAKNRYHAGIKNKITLEDLSRFEVGGSLAVLVNTVPASFWTLVLFYAHPGLLDKLREEADACTDTKTVGGTTTKVLDMATLKASCPLLLSAYQEVLRYRSMGMSVREVVEDTYLDQWLLKKGTMLQMPSRVIHQDASLWGESVGEFNPRRFLAEEKGNRPSDICFRAFGGGKTLCPGRHFATNEVLAIVALFISRFEMKPVAGGWDLPTAANTNAAAVIMEPDNDIEVEITPREGFGNVKWAVNLEKSDRVFAMVTEDTDKTG
ncbi:cytochrome P450 [Podospora conica]|nr:cytochrome P450 [Schizothecium conicum]